MAKQRRIISTRLPTLPEEDGEIREELHDRCQRKAPCLFGINGKKKKKERKEGHVFVQFHSDCGSVSDSCAKQPTHGLEL